jgi:hypothetical protein
VVLVHASFRRWKNALDTSGRLPSPECSINANIPRRPVHLSQPKIEPATQWIPSEPLLHFWQATPAASPLAPAAHGIYTKAIICPYSNGLLPVCLGFSSRYSKNNVNLEEEDANDVDRVLTCFYCAKDYDDEVWEIRRHSSG